MTRAPMSPFGKMLLELGCDMNRRIAAGVPIEAAADTFEIEAKAAITERAVETLEAA